MVVAARKGREGGRDEFGKQLASLASGISRTKGSQANSCYTGVGEWRH